MPVVAYLPAPLLASLRRALPRARVAESWHELLRLVSAGQASTAVVDPAADAWKATDALLDLRASYPSLNVVLYTTPVVEAVRPLMRLAAAGVTQIALYR